MFDYTAIIVAIITSISTIAGIYLKEWLFPKRKEQKLTIEKSNCYIELDKICASIRDTVHALSLIHISEPTRLGMISYAVFCLKKKKMPSTA